MANRYVNPSTGNDANAGTEASPWKTLSKARTSVNPGDIVYLRGGTYNERLIADVNNVKWTNYPSETPVIDGGYSINTCVSSGNDWRSWSFKSPDSVTQSDIKKRYLGQVQVSADDVTLDGLTIQNSGGRGIVSSAKRTIIRNCAVYFTYEAAITIAPSNAADADGILMEDVICTYASVMGFDPNRRVYMGGCKAQCVQGVVKLKATNITLRRVYGAYGFGEGLNIGRGAIGVLVEECVFHDCAHKHFYINGASDVIVRRCVSFCSGALPQVGDDGDAPAGYAITMETGQPALQSQNVEISNCFSFNDGFPLQFGGHTTVHISDIYVGFNTFVGGPWTKQGIFFEDGTDGPNNGLFENNIIDYRYAPDKFYLRDKNGNWVWVDVNITSGGSFTGGVKFRNNFWSTKPPTKFQGANDKYGDPGLVRANAPIAVGEQPTSAGTTYTYDLTPYYLTKTSQLINAASDGSALAGITPPLEPRQLDFLKASRSGVPDIGAVEQGASAGSITCDFDVTPSTRAGVAPLAVTIDENCATSDGTLTKWIISWGDGSPDTTVNTTWTNQTHTYQNPGTWTMKMTVTNSLGWSASKSDTVNVSPKQTGESVVTDIITGNLLTSPGTVSLPFSLQDFGAAAIVMYVTQATVPAPDSDPSWMCVGMWSANGGQRCDVFRSDHNEGAATDTWRGYYDDQIVVRIGGSGEQQGSGYISGTAGDTATLTITQGFPDNYTFVAFGIAGNGVQVARRSVTLGALDELIPVLTGFQPNAVIAASAYGSDSGKSVANIHFSLGFAKQVGSSNPINHCVGWFSPDGASAGAPAMRVVGDKLGTTDFPGSFMLESTDAQSASFRVTRADLHRSANLLLIRTFDPDLIDVGMIYPTAQGEATKFLPWTPQFCMALMSQATNTQYYTGQVAGSGGVALWVPARSYSIAWAEKSGALPTDTSSTIHTGVYLPDHTGAEFCLGSWQIDDAFAEAYISFTNPPPLTHVWPILSIGPGATSDKPIADFDVQYDSRNIYLGEPTWVNNLSVAPGSDPITTSIIDWGDDTTDTISGAWTTQQHVYADAGIYSVSLTVTNLAGSDTKTRPDYITVKDPGGGGGTPLDSMVMYAMKPGTLDEETKNKFFSDPEGPTPGLHTHEIGSTGVEFAADGLKSWAAKAGIVKMGYDGATDSIKFVRYDGALAWWPLTWTGGGGDPPVDPPPGGGPQTYEQTFQIDYSTGEARELYGGDGSVDLTATAISLTSGGHWFGQRFKLPIPQGATINSAIPWYWSRTYDDPNQIDYYIEESANAPSIVSATNNITSRTRAAISAVLWTETNLGTNLWVDGPDLKTLIQHIVNRADWVANNYVLIIGDCGASTSFGFWCYRYAPEYGTKLTVSWTV